jgi:hypothetical protein
MFNQSSFFISKSLSKNSQNEDIRRTHNIQNIQLCFEVRRPFDCIQLTDCTTDNIDAYKAQINAILLLLQNQGYRVHYEPQSSEWRLDYNYESRSMYDRLETQEEKTHCIKKWSVIGDCVLTARTKYPHNITNQPMYFIMDEDDLAETEPAINWEHSIFHVDKDYSIWTKIQVTFYYDVNKKVFFLCVSMPRGMKRVKETVIRYIQEQLPNVV